MVLDELVTYLAADGLGLVAATNLFYGAMPATPDLVVVLYEYPGMSSLAIGQNTISIEWPNIHVEVRGAQNDYATPRALLHSIVASFTKIGDQTLSGTRYGGVIAKQPPFRLGQDDDNRYLFACNFQVMKDFS